MIKVANIIRHPRGPRLVKIADAPDENGEWYLYRSWTAESLSAPTYDDAVVGAAEVCASANARPDPTDQHLEDVWLALSHVRPEVDGGAA